MSVLVVGLGRSGRAAATLLAGAGRRVVAIDAAPVAAPELDALGVDVRAPADGPVAGVDLVVKSPGVPADFAPVAAARRAGVPIWSEIELAVRELANPLIAITGTNGKTTTTELCAHLLRVGGYAARPCGNQGQPLAELVGAVAPDEWLVVECSSFQLEDTHSMHAAGAALLNLAPDHLDRHGSLAAYRAAKMRVFRHQDGADLSLAPAGTALAAPAVARHVSLAGPEPGAAAWADGGLHVGGLGRVCGWDEIPLRGAHNRQNALAAAALAAHAGVGADDLARGLATFAGVPHRLEVVAERAGVTFVNDSKATNPAAAIAALDAYPAGVHLICGGRGKGTPFAELATAARSAVVRAYLIGEAAEALAAAFSAGEVAHEESNTIERAVAAARARARPGETVLLAPACASFDQFASYEERGAAFREAVMD